MEASAVEAFPHLYRCGHIEASGLADDEAADDEDFRIFIDAATLKPASDASLIDAVAKRFPHLYRCGHIEARPGLAPT